MTPSAPSNSPSPGASLSRTVWVGVFGATTGFTVTRFSPSGAREVHHADIPWIGDVSAGIEWPRDWLRAQLDALVARSEPDDLLSLAMPGADLALLDADGHADAFPLQHYRGVMDGGFIERATALIPPETLYRRTGGANVAAFQPYAQLLAVQDRYPGLLERAAAVVPLSDSLTALLCGERAHDPVMLQDQGLTGEGRAVCQAITGLPGLADKLAPWRVFGETEAPHTSRGSVVMPVTHDSVPARMVGYSACPWVIWTGTWIGTACQVAAMDPTPEAYRAGIAFEGYGASLSAITNVAMLGRAYKAVVHHAGYTFPQAAARAGDHLEAGLPDPFEAGRLPADETAALHTLRERYGPDPDRLLAAVIGTTATACAEKIAATARVLGQPHPDEVAVIGGWARNEAFIGALRRFFTHVRLPAQAPAATAVGLAAEALVRVGDAPDITNALRQIPPLETES